MTNTVDINKVAEYTSVIKDLTDSAGDFAEAFGYVKAFSGLSKISASLGVLGAAFAVIGMVSGEESDTDKILNAIDQVSDQIEDLGDRMEAQLDRLETVVKETSAREQIVPAVSYFEGLRICVNLLSKESNKNSTKAKQLRASLRNFTVDDILTNAQIIVLTLADKQFANNILESAYKVTYGDIRTLNHLAGGLMTYLCFAAQAHGLVLSLGSNEEEMKNFPSDIVQVNSKIVEDCHQKGLVDSQKAWKSVIKKCEEEMSSNVEAKTRYLITKSSKKGDHRALAIYLKDELKKQFFWNDWLAIVYNDVRGYDTHAMWGYDYKAIFRYHGLNVVVKWVAKTTPTLGRGKDRPHGIEWNFLAGMPMSAERYDWKGNNMGGLVRRLLTPLKRPGFIWRCDRYKGVHAAYSNGSRLIWKNGEITFCLFE